MPLNESLGPAINGPQTGFFVADPASRTAVDDKVVRAGMQIRNLLNDDGPVETTRTQGEDWFAAGDDDAGSATEDETEHGQAAGATLARPSSAQPTTDTFARFEHTRRSVDDSHLAKGFWRHPPPPPRAGVPYPAPRQSFPSPSPSWRSSPADSPSPAYSPFVAGAGRSATPTELYRRSDTSAPGPPPADRQPSDYFNAKPVTGYERPFARTSAYPSASQGVSQLLHDGAQIARPISSGSIGQQQPPFPPPPPPMPAQSSSAPPSRAGLP